MFNTDTDIKSELHNKLKRIISLKTSERKRKKVEKVHDGVATNSSTTSNTQPYICIPSNFGCCCANLKEKQKHDDALYTLSYLNSLSGKEKQTFIADHKKDHAFANSTVLPFGDFATCFHYYNNCELCNIK